MNSRDIVKTSIAEKLYSLAKLFATLIVLLGGLVLIGWQFDISLLKSILPHLIAMNPITAIGFICAGIALLLIHRKQQNNLIIYSLGTIPFLLGTLKLSDTFFDLGINVDQILFSSKLDQHLPNVIPNRMAPNTAFNFIFAGLAFILIKAKIKNRFIPSQYAALIIGFVALLSIIGYIYQVKAFYGVMSYIPMAIHTAIGFLLLSFALLFQTPQKGLMLVLTSNYEGSNTAKLLIPAAIVLPISLGYLRLVGQRNDIYSVEFGMALLVITIIVVFIVLIWYNSKVLNNRDKFRRDAEFRISELNEELQQINFQLANVNHNLESFTYSVSHDLKAPLRAVISYAQILEEDYGKTLNDDARSLLATIFKNAKKMNTLIDDLLAFSKLERTDVLKKEVDIKAMIEHVWNELSQNAPHNAEIRIADIHVAYADDMLLQQVIVNLLSNAVKYSAKKEKPLIKVTSQIKDNHIVYSIADNGAGFDMKYAENLFGVFQRLHRTSEFDGTGVGLAIVKRIINPIMAKSGRKRHPMLAQLFISPCRR
jgi:signal transduction histidine kinase